MLLMIRITILHEIIEFENIWVFKSKLDIFWKIVDFLIYVAIYSNKLIGLLFSL